MGCWRKGRSSLDRGKKVDANHVNVQQYNTCCDHDFFSPPTFEFVKEGNWLVLFDGWLIEYVSVDSDVTDPRNGIRLRRSKFRFYTECHGWYTFRLVLGVFDMSVLSPDMLWFAAVNTPQNFAPFLLPINCPHSQNYAVLCLQKSWAVFL